MTTLLHINNAHTINLLIYSLFQKDYNGEAYVITYVLMSSHVLHVITWVTRMCNYIKYIAVILTINSDYITIS